MRKKKNKQKFIVLGKKRFASIIQRRTEMGELRQKQKESQSLNKRVNVGGQFFNLNRQSKNLNKIKGSVRFKNEGQNSNTWTGSADIFEEISKTVFLQGFGVKRSMSVSNRPIVQKRRFGTSFRDVR